MFDFETFGDGIRIRIRETHRIQTAASSSHCPNNNTTTTMSLLLRSLLPTTSSRLIRSQVSQGIPNSILRTLKTTSVKESGDTPRHETHEEFAKRSRVHEDEINPSDPHGHGYSDIFLGKGVVKQRKSPKTPEDFMNPDLEAHWISWGLDRVNKAQDRFDAHFLFFFAGTGVMYLVIVFLWYYPDYRLDSWAQREAYLEMARRKKLGGPYISRDYVPADRIKLPTDEELGDAEIII